MVGRAPVVYSFAAESLLIVNDRAGLRAGSLRYLKEHSKEVILCNLLCLRKGF